MARLDRRAFLKGAGLACAAAMGYSMETEPMKKRPNVLIIFPDQLRRYAAGYWSQPPYREHVIGEPDPVVTPNIDALASGGAVFTNAISNSPVCSPYRGMLLSGMYPEKNGLTTNCHKSKGVELRKDLTTITDVFYAAGYNTAYFGKFHWVRPEPVFDQKDTYVGSKGMPGGRYVNLFDTYVPPGPHRHGIEYFYQTIRDSHCDPLVYSSDPKANDGNPDGTPSEPKQLSTKLECDSLLEYLKNSHGQRDPDKPFFAVWSINPPHASWSDKHIETKYRDLYYNDERFPEAGDLLVRENLIKNAATDVKHARNYFSAVTSVDHYIGKVIEHLREARMLENTLVLFTADHGEYLGSHHNHGKNGPYLEAYGVPFILSWPGRIKSGVDDNMISVPDIFPTILGLTGMEEATPSTVQGVNYAARIIDPEAAEVKPATDALLSLNAGNRRGIISNEYVLVVDGNTDKAESPKKIRDFLFDNRHDPYQTRKIPLSERPKEAKALLVLLAKRLREIDDSWWQKRHREDVIPWRE